MTAKLTQLGHYIDGKPVAGPYPAIVELAPGKDVRLRARSRDAAGAERV